MGLVMGIVLGMLLARVLAGPQPTRSIIIIEHTPPRRPGFSLVLVSLVCIGVALLLLGLNR